MEGSEFTNIRIPFRSPEATHLDRPLRDTIPLLTLKYLKKGLTNKEIRKNRNIVKELEGLKGFTNSWNFITDPFPHWAEWYKRVGSNVKGVPSLQDWLEIARRSHNLQLNGTHNFHPTSKATPPILPVSDEIQRLWAARHFMEVAVRATAAKCETREEENWGSSQNTKLLRHNSSELGTIILGTFIFIWIPPWGNKEAILMSRDFFLLFSDLISERFLILISSHLATETHPTLYPSPLVIQRILRWGDLVLQSQGNQGFNMISQWESLCTAVLIKNNPGEVVDPDKFYNEVVKDMTELEKPSDPPLKGVLKLLDYSVKKSNHWISQLFGLHRLWGHPIVDLRGGIAKLRSIACAPKALNHQWIDDITIDFKEQLCMNYKRRKGKYPELEIENLPEDSYLKECLTLNSPIVVVNPAYNRLDWLLVKGLKTFEVQSSFSMVDLLSDKAMSLGVKELLEEMKRNSIGPGWKRSVLFQWLTSNMGTPLELLTLIDQYGFPEEECVVGVSDKERELKILARFFGLLTLWKRMYVVITESMVAHDILPLFPEITMMDDLTTLLKKLYRLTEETQIEGKYWEVTYSVDFEKWNSFMRAGETHGIFLFLDQLYGFTKVFTRTHEMFEGSTLYLANGTFIPSATENGQIKEGPYSWTGHLGGIEGLRQKGWTLFSLLILKRVADHIGVPFSLVGQGDNQVFRVRYPKGKGLDWAKRAHQEFERELQRVLAQIGPPNKPSETWASEAIFSYGKFIIVRGVPLSMNLKRICRFFRQSNEGYPTISGSISSCTSNLNSSLASSLEITTPYLIYSLEVIGAIWYGVCFPVTKLSVWPESDRWKVYGAPNRAGVRDSFQVSLTKEGMRSIKTLDHSLLLALLLFPQVLGGFPITLLGTCYIKGFPDPITEAISLLKPIIPKTQGQLRVSLINILAPVLSSVVNSTMIMQDPEALNIIRESTVEERMKRFISNYLGKAPWVTNRKMKPILEIAEERQDELCDVLYSMTPFNPRVGHEVVGATLVGRAMAIISRMTKTHTLATLSQRDTDEDLGSLLGSTDIKVNKAVLGQLMTPGSISAVTGCSTIKADSLRSGGWRKTVSGVTTSSHWEAFSRSEVPCVLCPSPDGYVLARLPELWDEGSRKGLKVGGTTPFLGSKTKEKIGRSQMDIKADQGPLMKQATRLLRIVNWGVERGSRFHSLLKDLLASFSNHPSSWYESKEGQTPGSIEHRWMDSVTKHSGALPILYTIATFIHLSTSSLTKYSKGGGNYTLHFQALMLAITTSLTQDALSDLALPSAFHYHIVCGSCIREINEESLEIHPLKKVKFPSLIGTDEYSTFDLTDLEDEDSHCEIQPRPTFGHLLYLAAGVLVSDIVRVGHEIGEGRRTGADSAGIPVVWADRLPAHSLLIRLTLSLLRRILVRMNLSRYTSLEVFWSDMDYRVGSWSADSLSGLSYLLLPSSQRFLLAGAPLFLITPPQSPPTLGQCTDCLKRALIRVWDLLKMGQSDLPLLEEEVILSPDLGLSDHPLLAIALLRFLKSPSLELLEEFSVISKIVERVLETPGGKMKGFEVVDLMAATLGISNPLSSQPYSRFVGDLNVEIKRLPSVALTSTKSLYGSFRLNGEPFSGHSYPLLKLSQVSLKEGSGKYGWSCKIPFVPGPTSSKNHYFKTSQLSTSAAPKLMSVVSRFVSTSFPVVACVGDGSGNFALLSSAIWPKSLVYYQTLLNLNGVPPQSLTEASPPAFDPYPESRNRLTNLRESYEVCTDLTSPNWGRVFRETVRSPCLLICDAEGGGWREGRKGVELARAVCESGSVAVILKSYSSNLQMLRCQLAYLLAYYEDVEIRRSRWSGINNTEVYILAWNRSQVQAPVLSEHHLVGPTLSPDFSRVLVNAMVSKANWDYTLQEEDKLAWGSLIRAAPQRWSVGSLREMFPTPPHYFPDDIIRSLSKGSWVKGTIRPRTRFSHNLWTYKHKRLCIRAFLVGYIASTWALSGGVPELRPWLEGRFVLWKTLKNWAWVVQRDCEDGEALSDFIQEGDLGGLYILAGESNYTWEKNDNWSNPIWKKPQWARVVRLTKSASRSLDWEVKGEEEYLSSSSFASRLG